MILRLFTITLLLLALQGQVQVQAQDNSTTPTATTTPTPTVTVTPTTETPTTPTPTTPTPTVTPTPTTETPTTPTTTAPITTSPPTTETPTTLAPTTPSATTATPTTTAPTVTQAPTTLSPTTPAVTTPPPTTQPPIIEDTVLLTTSNQGKILSSGITTLRISGNDNYLNNGTIILRVSVDGTSTGSKVLTISPRVDDVLDIPSPATLIPLSIGSRILKGLALDVDDNSAITNIRIYSPQLSTTIYNRISDSNMAVGLFVLQKDNANTRTYRWVASATLESLQKAVSAEIPSSAMNLDSILVFASYPTPPTITASLANNIAIIPTIGSLNTTINYANTGLSIRVNSPMGNQLHVEKIYGLNDKQEIARRNFGKALVYFKISLNYENVPQDTLLSYTFTQQDLNNAGIRSGSQLRWGYYSEQRNVWVQNGNPVDSAGGVVTTNTDHLSTWGVFEARDPNAASTISISFVIVIATSTACMTHLL